MSPELSEYSLELWVKYRKKPLWFDIYRVRVLIMPTAHVWFISMTMSEFRGGKLEASRLLSFGKIKQLGTSPYHNQHNEPLCRRVLSTQHQKWIELSWLLI